MLLLMFNAGMSIKYITRGGSDDGQWHNYGGGRCRRGEGRNSFKCELYKYLSCAFLKL